MAEYDEYEQFREPGGAEKTVWGADIASAATIAPTHKFHRVTGTAAIVTITAPYTGFEGVIGILPTGLSTWTAAGNIAVAGSSVVNRMVIFTYNRVTSKWYPSYV